MAQFFSRLDVSLPVCQPTVSTHAKPRDMYFCASAYWISEDIGVQLNFVTIIVLQSKHICSFVYLLSCEQAKVPDEVIIIFAKSPLLM